MARAAAAVVVLGFVGWIAAILLGGPPTLAAVLEPVAEATGRVKAVHVVMRMLTGDGEDFSYVNLEGDPRPVEAWVRWPVMPGDPGQARIDKEDRVYSFDGVETVFHHPLRNEAFRGRGAGVGIDLFWPAAWLRHMRDVPPGDVEILDDGRSRGQAWVLFRERGVDTAGLEPSFLGEFDRETEVVWNLDNHLLEGLRRWVYHNGERVLFSEIVTIEYPDSLDEATFRLDLPEDVRWGGVKEAPIELLDLGPREVARRLFEAAERGDRDELELFCPSPMMVDWLLEQRPIEILFLGDPFRSESGPQVFVPYRVRFGDHVKEFNLALRNDNAQRRWVYDGGI
jgi:hypothetical protein